MGPWGRDVGGGVPWFEAKNSPGKALEEEGKGGRNREALGLGQSAGLSQPQDYAADVYKCSLLQVNLILIIVSASNKGELS